MATRFYLTNSAPEYMPTTIRGDYEDSTSTLTRALSPTKSGNNTSLTTSSGGGSGDWILFGRWSSPPMTEAGTLSGTVDWVIGLMESSTSANSYTVVDKLYVTQGDTNTVRGNLLSRFRSNNEHPTTARGWGEGVQTLTSVTCQAGDRIVLELGRARATSTDSHTGTLYYGGTGATDLVHNNTAVTTNPGWFEFSGADALFVAPPATNKGAFFAFF